MRDTRREGAIARRAAWERERQDARDELKAQVWLPADPSRRLRAIAARTGLQPEQILAQLADRLRMNDDGALAVDTSMWSKFDPKETSFQSNMCRKVKESAHRVSRLFHLPFRAPTRPAHIPCSIAVGAKEAGHRRTGRRWYRNYGQ
jgi:hypothetical protein